MDEQTVTPNSIRLVIIYKYIHNFIFITITLIFYLQSLGEKKLYTL